MSRIAFPLSAGVLLCSLAACSRPPSTTKAATVASPATRTVVRREIHITGVVQAVRSTKVVVPAIQGSSTQMTLTNMVDNGARVKEGDLIASFDPTQQMDAARDAKAKFEDLGHQVDQKKAENRASAESRVADMRQAQADLTKAKLELTKEAVLAPIDLARAKARAANAQTHLDSLRKSQAFREQSQASGLRILELQRDRQRINLQRAQDNIAKLEIHAPLAGMVALEFTRRTSSYGHAQIGDQLYRNNALLSIFDPSEMQVRCSINEPDILAIENHDAPASVTLDAYPDISLPAHFVYASPVAAGALDSPVKSFVAVFAIEKADPHLLPDLSAAVVMTIDVSANRGKDAK
jgi:multidrug resistance efflux pump